MNKHHRTNLDDASLVVLAAELLDISEFRLFMAAFHEWFEREPSESLVERYFVAYLFEGAVPFWVRHFARNAVRECANDRRDARRPAPQRLVDALALAALLFLLPVTGAPVSSAQTALTA